MSIRQARRAGAAVVVAAAGLALAACGGGANNATGGTGGGQLSGPVVIDGSSTVEPLSSAAAELFQGENPGVTVTVGTSGTGGGFQKFCNGETDISDASRPIKAEETAACQARNVAYEQLQVANDALTVVVAKGNTWANCLTVDQLKAIWEPDSPVTTWNQVDPSFPNEPIALFGPGADSGTFDYFTEEINGKEGVSRTDYSPSENDNVIVQGVEGNRGAMGYFGFSYFEENQDKLKAVEINGGGGCVAPSSATVQDGTYTPLARPLFIYVSDAALKKPQVVSFSEFYLGRNDQIVEAAKFVPMTPEQKQKANDALAALKQKAGV
ncbi:PstS family phosphate ABC transporter substrate-binding protein [Pseudonocardia sp. H11422]|uniref:PstS family phosphate ABC transporter substrate-binding protein n=1 Tax=Pseudonocardia sp. H11422 TaxID=2835866 RepID=UPI001BDD7ED7|nr:PstS family phosphate ABC transporter substrate-binding protein [Pseudonocardia sp. H11422]